MFRARMSTAIVEPQVNSGRTPTTSSSHNHPQIDESHARFFRENGYLVVENAISIAEVEELRREAVRICRGEIGPINGAPEISPTESDDDVMKKILCIHNPHKFSKVLHPYLATRTMVEVLTRIISPNVKAMQSMLFIKAAGKPGQAWHQDEFYIPTRDRSLCGGWIAMDRATTENGCLWVIPGSHKHGVLCPQHWHGDRRFDCAGEAFDFPYSDDDAIPVEVNAGAIVFFNGYLLHRSFPNRAQSGFRRCLVNHYMSAESLLPWQVPKDGKSVATTDFRDIVMVAGRDPYAYKGIEDILKPSIRPSGEGGCQSWGSDRKYIK